jgi:hypothetical protein
MDRLHHGPSVVRKPCTRCGPGIGFYFVPRSPLNVTQMPAKANSGRSSFSANHTTSFLLVSGFGSGAYSAKLLAGTRERFSGFSQPRQCGDDVLRMLVTGGPVKGAWDAKWPPYHGTVWKLITGSSLTPGSSQIRRNGFRKPVAWPNKLTRPGNCRTGRTRHMGGKTPHRMGTSPARTLIDATFPALHPKQKSRWSRALEFAAMTKVTPDDLPKLFKNYSGIAGCARFAAKQKPKKNMYRDDWA